MSLHAFIEREGSYDGPAIIVSVVVFLVVWLAIAINYGAWGILLGWLLAAPVAALIGSLWPIFAILVVFLVMRII